MLLQPITVPFSKSTLKPSVYTLRHVRYSCKFEKLLIPLSLLDRVFKL